MAVRLSVHGAEEDPETIDLIRRAIARMQGLHDDRGYDFFASLHGFSLPAWCQHGTSLFLPWHRAFLYYFELALQTRLGPRFTIMEPQEPDLADVGLPWWDWTSEESHETGLPDSYGDPRDDNPLYHARIATFSTLEEVATGVWSRFLIETVRASPIFIGTIASEDPPTTLRDPDPPHELPSANDLMTNVMEENTYDGFWNKLENVHDAVHVWVGGAMSAVPTAAYDPVFWSHHAMIDRLWYIWQISQKGAQPPADLLSVVLSPFPMTVAQTLDIANLRYEYAVQASA